VKQHALSTAPTITFTKSGSAGRAAKPAAADADDVIECFGQAQYPHQSTGTPSAIDGKAQSYCTKPVHQVGVEAELYRYLDGFGFTVVSISGLSYENDKTGPVTAYGLDICPGLRRVP
jgi:hypothetical protein